MRRETVAGCTPITCATLVIENFCSVVFGPAISISCCMMVSGMIVVPRCLIRLSIPMPSLALDGTLPGGRIRVRKRLILSGSLVWIRGRGTQRSITCNETHNDFINFGEWNPLRRIAEPHPSLFLLPFDLLGGAVSKVPGFARLGVEAFLDFGVADALFF